MNVSRTRWLALKFGLLIAAICCGLLSLRFPAFFSDGAPEIAKWIAILASAPAALALPLMLVTKRWAAPIGVALGSTPLVVGLVALDLPSLSIVTLVATTLLTAALLFFVVSRSWADRRGVTIACLAAIVGALGLGAAGRNPAAALPSDHPRLFVFGLDAGTWTILDELIAHDQLPNLRRIRDEGTSGILKSEVESASPRVWTTIATGKHPEKHGVLDFFCKQNEDLKTRRLWEILAAQGWSVGLFQWLVTWPPDPFDPFVVPAWMARGPETRPTELAFIKELELAFQNGEFDDWLAQHDYTTAMTRLRNWGVGYLRHGLRLKTVLAAIGQATIAATSPDWEARYAAKRTLQLAINGDVYLALYREHLPDFSCFICYGTDNLAHKFWQYHYPDDFHMPHERAAPYSDVLTSYYRAADALLGEILPLLSPQTTIAVLSDHGFTSIGEGGESHQRMLRPKMSHLASLVGLSEQQVKTSSIATRGFFRPVAGEGGAAGAAAVGDRIVAFLEACRTGADDARLFLPSVRESGEIEVAVNLDLELEEATPIVTPAGRMRMADLIDIEERTGNHSVDGIVLLRGPAIRRGARIEGATLADITPTLLYLNELAVGADMDGHVLLDAVLPSVRAEREVERIASWDDLVSVQRSTTVEGDERSLRKYLEEQGYVAGSDESEAAKKRATEEATRQRKKE